MIVSIPMVDSTLVVDKKAQISIVGRLKKEKIKNKIQNYKREKKKSMTW